ncbi:MAG: hypothetical protein WAX89_00055 [Alphaproteobacteria bacterium]
MSSTATPPAYTRHLLALPIKPDVVLTAWNVHHIPPKVASPDATIRTWKEPDGLTMASWWQGDDPSIRLLAAFNTANKVEVWFRAKTLRLMLVLHGRAFGRNAIYTAASLQTVHEAILAAAPNEGKTRTYALKAIHALREKAPTPQTA